jgi:hypothetical protein
VCISVICWWLRKVDARPNAVLLGECGDMVLTTLNESRYVCWVHHRTRHAHSAPPTQHCLRFTIPTGH